MRVRTRIIAALAIVALLGGPVPVASAHKFFKGPTKFKRAEHDGTFFKGRIRSPRPWCQRNRQIEITFKNKVIARTRTNRKGWFRIRRPNPRTGWHSFLAVPKVVAQGKHGHQHWCVVAARSYNTWQR